MNTANRLQNYYDFDDSVLENVSLAAEMQNKHSFAELAHLYGIADGSQTVLAKGAHKPIEILTFKPLQNYDTGQARILHMPFGTSLGKNAAMHAIRLFASDPEQQLIVVGGPAEIGNRNGLLTAAESRTMMRDKTFNSTVVPLLQHLEQSGITRTVHMGYSAGADKAATAAGLSPQYGQNVTHGVFAEPVTVTKRSLIELAKTFAGTRHAQQGYIQQTKSRPFLDIWAEDNIAAFARYAGGLLRLSNLAIATALASNGFEDRLHQAIDGNPNIKTTTAWGTKSELVDDKTIGDIVLRVGLSYINRPVVFIMPLENMHHAGVDDIDLHAAIMLQGMRH